MTARQVHDAAVARGRNVMGRYAALHDRKYEDQPLEVGVHDLMVDLMHSLWQVGVAPGEVVAKAVDTYWANVNALG